MGISTSADLRPVAADAADATIEIGQWCFDHMAVHDIALLGAFEFVMKQRRTFGGTAAQLADWFSAFSGEGADAPAQAIAAKTFQTVRASALAEANAVSILLDTPPISAVKEV